MTANKELSVGARQLLGDIARLQAAQHKATGRSTGRRIEVGALLGSAADELVRHGYLKHISGQEYDIIEPPERVDPEKDKQTQKALERMGVKPARHAAMAGEGADGLRITPDEVARAAAAEAKRRGNVAPQNATELERQLAGQLEDRAVAAAARNEHTGGRFRVVLEDTESGRHGVGFGATVRGATASAGVDMARRANR